jgi:hypothetical protein
VTADSAAELRAAASKLRRALDAVDAASNAPNDSRPWHAEECAEPCHHKGCRCIVVQGEYPADDEENAPMVQCIADAETTEHAEWIATMQPAVGLALVEWLNDAANGDDEGEIDPHALVTARAINAESAAERTARRIHYQRVERAEARPDVAVMGPDGRGIATGGNACAAAPELSPAIEHDGSAEWDWQDCSGCGGSVCGAGRRPPHDPRGTTQ